MAFDIIDLPLATTTAKIVGTIVQIYACPGPKISSPVSKVAWRRMDKGTGITKLNLGIFRKVFVWSKPNIVQWGCLFEKGEILTLKKL